ncbi:hypothetical protein C0991_011908 [Blastosporella zonata]|nr:hypothetical protein C0991_011908 [Blastosporella zonata]
MGRSLTSHLSEPEARTETPAGSIVVTLSTPQGSAQTAQSSLRTQTSASVATERELSRDIDRIADGLRQYDIARGNENRELADNVRALRDELHNLSEYLHRTPSPQHPSQPITSQPMSIPTLQDRVDQRVGGSSPVSLLPPHSSRGLDASSGLSRASSNASSIGSYLSSHHSDDEYLQVADSPSPWHTSTSTDITETETESIFIASPPPQSPLPASTLVAHVPPPQHVMPTSPSPNFSSSSTSASSSRWTVRPNVETPPDLSGPLNQIRERLTAVWEGQISTNHMLDTLRNRERERASQVPQVDTELRDRLRRIEGLLGTLTEQRTPEAAPAAEMGDEPYPPPALSAIGSVTTSLAEFSDRLRNFNDLPAPAPTRPRPSLLDRLEEMIAATSQLPQLDIQLPPGPINLQYNRREHRSISPVSIATLPRRPESEPSFGEPSRRPVRRTIPVRPAPDPQHPFHMPDIPPYQPEHVAETATEPIDTTVPRVPTERIELTARAEPADYSAPVPPVQQPSRVMQDRPRRQFSPPRPVIGSLHDPLPRSQTAPASQTPNASWYQPDSRIPLVGFLYIIAICSNSNLDSRALVLVHVRVKHLRVKCLQAKHLRVECLQAKCLRVKCLQVKCLQVRYLQRKDLKHSARLVHFHINECLLRLWLERDTTDRHNELRGLNTRVEELREAISDVAVRVHPPESERTSPGIVRSEGSSTPSALGPAQPVDARDQRIQMPVPRQGMRMPIPEHYTPHAGPIPLGFQLQRVSPQHSEGPVIPLRPFPSPFIPPVIPEERYGDYPTGGPRPQTQPFRPVHPPTSGVIPAPYIPPNAVRPTPGPVPGPMPTAPPPVVPYIPVPPPMVPYIPVPPPQESGSPPGSPRRGPSARPEYPMVYQEGTPDSSSTNTTNTTDTISSGTPSPAPLPVQQERLGDTGHLTPLIADHPPPIVEALREPLLIIILMAQFTKYSQDLSLQLPLKLLSFLTIHVRMEYRTPICSNKSQSQ